MLGEIKKGCLEKIILKLTFKKEFVRPRGKKAFEGREPHVKK